MNPARATLSIGKLFRTARWNLGLPDLAQEWKSLLTTKYLREDLTAGAVVACIALPLSFAVAIASDMSPATGLLSAIVGGIVCSLVGGVPLSVCGPTAAMSILIASSVERFGINGVILITLIAGFFQLLTGFFGFGKLVRLVPAPVVTGFTAGIGIIILIGQMPRALGLPPPPQAHIIEVIRHLKSYIHGMHPMVFILTMISIWIMVRMPKTLPKLPAPLFAVVVPTLLSLVVGIDVPTVGEIPRTLPLPKLPHFYADWPALITTALMVYAFASLETLLSASAVDRLSKPEKKYNPDQELIGQGFGQMAVSLFGGMPVTGVIARSALNVHAGAKTRRSSLFHSLFLLAAVFLLNPIIAKIPIAALAGVLLAVAANMVQLRDVQHFWQSSKSDAIVYFVTLVGVVFADLLAGVQAGILVAVLIAFLRLSKTRLFVYSQDETAPFRFTLQGPLSFLSIGTIDLMREKLSGLNPNRGVVIDLTQVDSIDSTAGRSLLDLAQFIRGRGSQFALKGLAKDLEPTLISLADPIFVKSLLIHSESQLQNLFKRTSGSLAQNRLVVGVGRFRMEVQEHYEEMFEELAAGQKPHTLFITCADSRILPNLITDTAPGEMLTIRNVGNHIPRYGEDETPAEGAALEFAVGILGIRNIVVCGHSKCGAMEASLKQDSYSEFPSMKAWIDNIRLGLTDHKGGPEDASKRNVCNQLEHLVSYPAIKKALADGLKISGWYYDVATAEVLQWSPEHKVFKPLN